MRMNFVASSRLYSGMTVLRSLVRALSLGGTDGVDWSPPWRGVEDEDMMDAREDGIRVDFVLVTDDCVLTTDRVGRDDGIFTAEPVNGNALAGPGRC